MTEIVLYDYWRSSACYRVRIALELLGLAYRTVPIDLLAFAHKTETYLDVNPQGLVPSLSIDGQTLTQSLSIIEYLAETRPDARLLPDTPEKRQRVRALSYAVAMDVHPICNLHVAAHVVRLTGDEDARGQWMKKFIGNGLRGLDRMLDDPRTGRFCVGDEPTMADLCLVPQVYNARRWGLDMSAFPRIEKITEACSELTPFRAAHPDVARQTASLPPAP